MGNAKPASAPPAESLHCSLGVGCEEAGVCYALANGDPGQCGKPAAEPVPVAHAPLSSRLRPEIECAPWVIEAVQKLEASLAACRALVPKWRLEDIPNGERGVFRSATTCADELEAVLPLAGDVAK